MPKGNPTPPVQRVMSRVLIDARGCWVFQGALQRGYGAVGVWLPAEGRGRVLRAHRVVYEAFVGPIPEGLDIDHLYRNRACVNPDHLEPVTRRENLRRGEGLIGKQLRQTHCGRGHALIPENLWKQKRSSRTCKKCRNLDRRLQSRGLGRLAEVWPLR